MNTNDFFKNTTGDKHMSIKLGFIGSDFLLARRFKSSRPEQIHK